MELVTEPTADLRPRALTVKEFSVNYGQRRVLNQIDFDLPTNTISCLLGPSGAGKSTLVLAIAGLLGDTASVKVTGKIEFCRDQSRKKMPVGIVFQKPHPFRLSIFENVALALRERGYPKNEIAERVEIALRKAGFWEEAKDRLKESAHRLSGGQQQRLCIARVLALEPSLLLLDEPCSSLDPIATRAIEETLRKLSETTTILVVTHNLGQAKRLAQHGIVLWSSDEGSTVLEAGPVKRLFESAQSETVRHYLSGQLG